jgi:hypothetical protein
MNKTYTVWMGYDPREDLAYRVARHSILSRTEECEVLPVELADPCVYSILTRPVEQKDGRLWCPISQAPMATEFAISRFCAPFLHKMRMENLKASNIGPWALFVDSDIICFVDIRQLFAELDDRYAVMCVKHKPHGKDGEIKMDDQLQTFYARKNWSSVMAINVNHPANLRFTLKDLNERPGRDLHAFFWLKDEEIGALENKWNVLVDVDDMNTVKFSGIWHYTLGGPFLPGWKGGSFDVVWRGAHGAMLEDAESSCKSAAPEESAMRYAKCDS